MACIARHGRTPQVAGRARIASTAVVVGDVRIEDDCVLDYGAVVASSGPQVVLGEGAVVMANAVVRSVGGIHRPGYAVEIGADSLIGPLAALAGCTVGDGCYVATGAMVFHGAEIGDGCRIGAGSIVHAGTKLPPSTRVGMRQYAVPGADGAAVVTGDLDKARGLVARADFFTRAFALEERDLLSLHRRAVKTLRAEAADCSDLPLYASLAAGVEAAAGPEGESGDRNRRQ